MHLVSTFSFERVSRLFPSFPASSYFSPLVYKSKIDYGDSIRSVHLTKKPDRLKWSWSSKLLRPPTPFQPTN